MYFDYNGIRLYYEKYGSGEEKLVILPGWGDTRKTFNRLIRTLEDYYTIYIVDYPGFGNTKFPSFDMTIYDYANLIHEWLNYLDLDNPTLLSHSFGGRIAITLTGYYQYKYEKIILMNSAGVKPKKTIRQKLRTKTYKLLKRLTKLLPKKSRKNLEEKLFNHYSSTDYRTLPNNMKKTFQNIVGEDLTNYLKDIKSECIILWGENDVSTPLKDGIIMNKNISKSKLYIFKDASYFVYLDRFQDVLETIVKFIEN